MPLIIIAVYMAAHVSEHYFRVSFPTSEFKAKMEAVASEYLEQTHSTQYGITWIDALKKIPKQLWEKHGFYAADDDFGFIPNEVIYKEGDVFLVLPKTRQMMEAASYMTSYLWMLLDQEILEQGRAGVMKNIKEFVCIWTPRFVDFKYEDMELFVEKALMETDPDFWEVIEEEEEFDPEEYGCEPRYAINVSKVYF